MVEVLKVPKPRKIFKGLEIARMALMKRRGMTYEQIAKVMFCHKGTVRRYLTTYKKAG